MSHIRREVIEQYLKEMEANGAKLQGVILVGVKEDGTFVGVNPIDTDDVDAVIEGAATLLGRWASCHYQR